STGPTRPISVPMFCTPMSPGCRWNTLSRGPKARPFVSPRPAGWGRPAAPDIPKLKTQCLQPADAGGFASSSAIRSGYHPPIFVLSYDHELDRVQHGSVDVIAVRDQTLLLVACTIGAPKDEDFSRLWHLRTLLVAELATHTTATVFPVLVTG